MLEPVLLSFSSDTAGEEVKSVRVSERCFVELLERVPFLDRDYGIVRLRHSGLQAGSTYFAVSLRDATLCHSVRGSFLLQSSTLGVWLCFRFKPIVLRNHAITGALSLTYARG